MAIDFRIQSVSAGGPVQAGRVDVSSGFRSVAGGFLDLARGIAQFQTVGKQAENEAAALNLHNKTKIALSQKYKDIDTETQDPRIRFKRKNEALEQTITSSFEQAQKDGVSSSFSKLSTKWFSKNQSDLLEDFDDREGAFSLQQYTDTVNNEYLPAFDKAHAGSVVTIDEDGTQRLELPVSSVKELSAISERMQGELGRALDSNDPDKMNKVVSGLRKTSITGQAKQLALMSVRDPDVDLTDLLFNTEIALPRIEVVDGQHVITYSKPTEAEVQDRATQALSFAAQNESRIQFQENREKAQKQEFAASFQAGIAQIKSVMISTQDFSMLDTMKEDLQRVQNQMTFDDRAKAWGEITKLEEVMRNPGAAVSDDVTLNYFTSQLDSKTRFPHKQLEQALLDKKLTVPHFMSLSSRHATMLSRAETDFDREKNSAIKIIDGLFQSPEAQIVMGDQGGKFTAALRIAVNERVSELGTTALNPDVARNIVFEESEKLMGAAIAGSDVGVTRQEWDKMAQLIIDAPVGEDREMSIQRARQALSTTKITQNKRRILGLGLSILESRERLQAAGAGFTLANRPATALSADPKTTAKKDDQALKQSRTVIRNKRPALGQYDTNVSELDRQLQEAASIVQETQETN